MPYKTLFEEILRLIREDAERLDCVKEVEHGRTILDRGTSAHRQIARWQKGRDEGKGDKEALRAVVDMLCEDTVHGL